MKKIVGHAVSNRGRVRENNEDNYLLGNCLNAESLDESETHFTQRAGLWTCAGVFDGMGGEAGGEIASNIASRVFQENTMNFDSFDREKISRHIEKTFAIANQAVVEERKKLNRCIEEAPNDYEKEIYRAIRNMSVPYEKLNEILENSRDIITSKQNRKAKNRKFFATGIPIIFMILVVAIYTLLNKQGDD